MYLFLLMDSSSWEYPWLLSTALIVALQLEALTVDGDPESHGWTMNARPDTVESMQIPFFQLLPTLTLARVGLWPVSIDGSWPLPAGRLEVLTT